MGGGGGGGGGGGVVGVGEGFKVECACVWSVVLVCGGLHFPPYLFYLLRPRVQPSPQRYHHLPRTGSCVEIKTRVGPSS